MINATNAVKTAAIGGRAAVSHLIYDAAFKSTIKLIQKFHLQRKENEKTKQIKAAFTLPRLNKATQHVATLIANKPPVQMPILRGLINETATKATSAMERYIESLKDQLKAAVGKTPNGAKKIQGRWEEITSGNLEEEGHPHRPQENYCPPHSPQCSRCQLQKFHAYQRKEETRGMQSLIKWEEGCQAHQLAQIDNLATREIERNYGFIPNTNISTHLNARHVLGDTSTGV
jgi:hypothetical protein